MKSVFLFCVIFHFIIIAKCNLQLKMLHVLFRHGEKVPDPQFQSYRNDPHANHSYLPIEKAGLTKLGMMREYTIGKLLREKYDDYFGSYYRPSLIYAQSTFTHRAKMSLQLVLAGLFPPCKEQEWNPNLPWIPIDLQYLPFEEDYLFLSLYCSQYKEELMNLMEEQGIKKIISNYKEILDHLTEMTGDIQTLDKVFLLHGLLKEQAAQNLTLPMWAQQLDPSLMKNMSAMSYNLRSYTTTLKRLNGGTLLRKITDDIKDVRDKKLIPPERKAFFFSGHDMNIAAFSKTLGLTVPVIPEYGATFIVETLMDEENQYFIRVYFWTGVSEQYLLQTIPGCKEICPLDTFLTLIHNVIPNDKEYYCYGIDNSNTSFNSALVHKGSICLLYIISFIYVHLHTYVTVR